MAEVKAKAKYVARGTIESFENRSIDIVTVVPQTTTSRSVTWEAHSTVEQWVDPLAQTFMVSGSKGEVITSVGLFFSKVPVSNIGVTCQIRDVVNGYPGKNILAETTLYPNQITVNTSSLNETRFRFRNPIFLKPNTEYCLAILSDSNEYKVWIARMGEQVINSLTTVSSQPSLGVLFKSQNGSTWTAEQYEDLCFVLYKANFNKNMIANIQFVPDTIPKRLLPTNPFTALQGSTVVRVNHPEHGFNNGDTVEFSGVAAGKGFNITSYNGLVSNVEYDSYTINMSVTATSSGVWGGSGVMGSSGVKMSSLTPHVELIKFTGTEVTLSVNTTNNEYIKQPTIYFSNNEEVGFNEEMVVSNRTNEIARNGGEKTFNLTVALSTTDSNLSPLINKNHVWGLASRYKVNNPNYEINHEVDKFTLVDNQPIIFSSSDDPNKNAIIISGALYTNNESLFEKVQVGKIVQVGSNEYYLITGSEKDENSFTIFVTSSGDDSGLSSASNIFDDGTRTTSLILFDRYIDEINADNSSVYSSYVTKEMRLKLPATAVKVTFDTIIPENAFVDVYYRTSTSSEVGSIRNASWVRMDTSNTASTNTLTEVDYMVENLNDFDVCQVKLVFRSSNSGVIQPLVKNLRVMALA